MNRHRWSIVLVWFLAVSQAACGDSTAKRQGSGDAGDTRDVSVIGGDTHGADTSTPSDTAAGDTGSSSDTATPQDTGTGDTPVLPGNVGDACDATHPCHAMLTCASGVCVRPGVACTTDSECQSDAYCCTQDCSPAALCIPYGTGPRGNVDEACTIDIVPGLFDARTQCEWAGPPSGDPYPGHVQVLTTPMVANLPNDSGSAAEIVIVSYNYIDGGSPASVGVDPNYFGVIRILNGQTCEQLENIDDPTPRIIASSPPAIGDLDNDGLAEIVTQRANSELVAFHWDPAARHYVRYWVSSGSNIVGAGRWDGPALHDLDDDGFPEVVSGSEVFDGRTGVKLNAGQLVSGASAGVLSVVADLDVDGNAELIGAGVYRWDRTARQWVLAYPGSPGATHYGFADFGTPGATAADFDPNTPDGIAEIVTTGGNVVGLTTLSGQQLMQAGGIAGGGPPTIGDFDNDGRPEIASAGGYAYRVFDLDCASAGPGCAGPWVRWTQPSQDLSSQTTGSSIFDFEGDGKAEAVYADECFARIYDGATGEVLFSAFRTSCTWYENAVIADPDRDSNTEILIGSNANCSIGCPDIDPIHFGQRCEGAQDCLSGVCDTGYCRCTDDTQCDAGSRCTAPPAGVAGSGNTCRAYHPPGVGLTGLRVLRDRLDRWASSRPLWNQHVYSVTNINDTQLIPRTTFWKQNFTDPALNNFRQNVQGATGANQVPDITGRFDDARVCDFLGNEIQLVAWVCNRGNRSVGAALPATFYLGLPTDGNVLCTSYTAGPVPVGECLEVACVIDSQVTGTITMAVNDDGAGGRTTVECNEDNNFDTVAVENCIPN